MCCICHVCHVRGVCVLCVRAAGCPALEPFCRRVCIIAPDGSLVGPQMTWQALCLAPCLSAQDFGSGDSIEVHVEPSGNCWQLMQLINVADAADAQVGARTRHIGASLLGNLGLRLHGLRPSP